MTFWPVDQLEHNFYLKLSKGPAFLWQAQIQTIKYDTLFIYTFWYEFSNNFDAKSDFFKKFVREKEVPWNYSYLKYALTTGIKKTRLILR